MRVLCILIVLLSTSAYSQTMAPPKIITERNGNITNHRAEGSLAVTHDVGCIELSEANNQLTPPDLYQGVASCLAQDRYDRAAALFSLAGVYGNFDAARVADKSAGQAKAVLIMTTFSAVSQDKKKRFLDEVKAISGNHEVLRKTCADIRDVGKPDYYPAYMILHGMGAFTENPHDQALVVGFDAAKVWNSLQTSYLHCPA
ncbi:hypothetical protein H261_01372 [Paramagnetospirillum caucaseum]|uniref:TPR repeat-containing protein n=1 Tax=Paramagnetospirillum caucaseum TaxID=1244869 RepID=M2ZWR0_9PROT|nr:hypothetical protein [Paramagnetospirillum caucaseum]EME71857.1 hypothetical protein H261_01372 [Paramagnetospirillum caucaseum]